jgi:hypothetical protein
MAASFLSASALALLALQTSQAAYLPNQLLPRQSAANETAAQTNTCPVPAPLQTTWAPSPATKNAKGEDGSRQSFGPPNVEQGKNSAGQPLTPSQGKSSKVRSRLTRPCPGPDDRRLTSPHLLSNPRSATSFSLSPTVSLFCDLFMPWSSLRPLNIRSLASGFGPASQTFARDYYQKVNGLDWHAQLAADTILVGSVRTRSSDSFVTDSAAAATAYASGASRCPPLPHTSRATLR